jgi:hypothetical protein
MKILILSLFIALPVIADPRYVTLEVTGTMDNQGTNSLTVAPYETVELLSFPVAGGSRNLYFKRDSVWYLYQDKSPLFIAGPATIELRGTGGIATFRLTPDSYPPDKSILIPPGNGGAVITLECSTNLVDWTVAQNDTYTNQPVAKFFRIRAQRIQGSP